MISTRDQDAHRTGAHQLEQAADRTRQARRDAGENDDRDAVAQAALGDLLTQPHQEHGAGRQRHHRGEAEAKPGSITRPALRFQRDRDAQRLEQRQRQRAVAGVLGDLAAAGFAFLLQRFQLRRHDRQQLHDDRGRDVRHDAQREHVKRDSAPPENMLNMPRMPPCWPLEQLVPAASGSMPGHRDVRTDAVHHQREQQEHTAGAAGRRLAALFASWAAFVANFSLLQLRSTQATEPPAASMAAFAPAVAPMPFSLTALRELAGLDDLDARPARPPYRPASAPACRLRDAAGAQVGQAHFSLERRSAT